MSLESESQNLIMHRLQVVCREDFSYGKQRRLLCDALRGSRKAPDPELLQMNTQAGYHETLVDTIHRDQSFLRMNRG